MTCTHTRAAAPISRFAMLFSTNGIGCYQCGARLRVPRRVRINLLCGLLVCSALILTIPIAAAGLIGVFALAGLPWLFKLELEVEPAVDRNAQARTSSSEWARSSSPVRRTLCYLVEDGVVHAAL